MKKMNISMGFLKPVQNFFKKYTALLPSIGIVIVALLLFFPTLMVGKGVKEKMKQSGNDAKKVRSLLGDVPSEDDPEQIKRYMDQLEEEATQIETRMTRSSQRELISYDVFPPISTSSQLYTEFGTKYRQAIESMVKDMNAKDAPSESEITAQTGGKARPTRSRTAGQSAAAEIDPMVDALCLTRSQEIAVYTHPSLFAWYEFWDDYDFQGENQALEDCWDSQVAFWIYSDIAETINKMNAGSQKVSSSPVKRLVGISFTDPVFDLGSGRNGSMRGRMGRGTTANRDIPNYVTDPSLGLGLNSNFVSAALTARKGDEDVDVVHFAFSVLLDNRLAMAFAKELCSEKPHAFRTGFKADGELVQASHNQITILQSDISVVDKQAPEHELYRYGKGAVMQLDLICEYQFIRKGYDSIKPEPIKTRLGQSEAEAGASKTKKKFPNMMMF